MLYVSLPLFFHSHQFQILNGLFHRLAPPDSLDVLALYWWELYWI